MAQYGKGESVKFSKKSKGLLKGDWESKDQAWHKKELPEMLCFLSLAVVILTFTSNCGLSVYRHFKYYFLYVH